MEKTKVLILNSDTDGVGYWRLLAPHLTMNDQFKDIHCDVRLMMDHTLPLMDVNFLKQYNIIIYNKILPIKQEFLEQFYNTLKQMNIKLIYDVDDYWILDNTHLNYKQWKSQNSHLVVENCIKNADAIFTTTPLFADKIKTLNPNVYVVENAVNLKEMQWTSNKEKSNKVRFIWGGGISHMVDLKLLKEEFKKFDNDFLNKSQLYLCGFDLRIRLPDGRIVKDDPRKSQWGHFEDIFTNNYKYIKDSKHMEYLFSGDDVNYGIKNEFKNEFYQRRWTKEIVLYGTMYNEADVSIAPLKGENHQFNYHKSQLKLIEAGAHHMPLICSNYGPYTVDDVEGKKDGIQKGLLVDENKNDWYEKMKFYVKNPSAVKEHGEANFEYIKSKFDIRVVNKKRYDIYKILSK
jgi:glycosyltransferase involved in cell wall biosynthesis